MHIKGLITSSIALLLQLTSTAVSADTISTYYPGNMCRAALESQDYAFRTYNDRFKNIAGISVYAVCPVPMLWDIGIFPQNASIGLINESSSSLTFTCNMYLYDAIFGSPLSPPYLAATSSETVGPGELASPFLSFGSSQSKPFFGQTMNIVCLLPSNTSIAYYQNVDGDYYVP